MAPVASPQAPPNAPGQMVLVQRVGYEETLTAFRQNNSGTQFSGDGGLFCVFTPGDRVEVWRFTDGKLYSRRTTVQPLGRRILSPDLTVTARRVTSGGVQIHVENLFSPANPKPVHTPGRVISGFVFSPDNTHSAVVSSRSQDVRIELWNWREPRMTASYAFNYAGQSIISMIFSPDGSRLYTVDEALVKDENVGDKKVHHLTGWNTAGQREKLFSVPLKDGAQLLTDPAGKWILTSGNLSTIGSPSDWQVHAATTGASAFAVFQPSIPLFFSSDGQYIASKHLRDFQLYDLEKKTTVPVAVGEDAIVQGFFTPDNSHLILRTITGKTLVLPHTTR